MHPRLLRLASRIPALLLSLGLHLSPLLRSAPGAALSPMVCLVRWLTGAAALSGSLHAVSGATGLTITQGGKTVKSSTGTNGVVFAGTRITVRSDLFGNAQSYQFDGLPPGLVGSPQGVVTGIPGAAGTFEVSVTGWQRSGLSGFRFDTSYSVVILEGTPTAPPQIDTPPQAQSGAPGDTITLSVAASGIGLSYQWIKDGQDLPGQTASTLTLSPLQLSDAGKYQVRVTNTLGSVTSKAVAVQVLVPGPQTPVLPASLNLYVGEPLSLDATSTGVEPLSYQWTLNGVPLIGETGPVLQRASVSDQGAGSYSAQVTDGAGGMATVGPVSVSVLSLPGLRWIELSATSGGTLEVRSEPGRGYRLEARSAADSGTWTEVSSAVATGAGLRFESLKVSDDSRFFRVVVLPAGP